MRYLLSVAMAASLTRAFAGAWFDTGISAYDTWPADGSDKLIVGQGVWTQTANATLLNSRLLVDTLTGDAALVFDPAVRKSTKTAELVYSMTTRFSVSDDVPSELPEMKCGISAVTDGDEVHFYGLTKGPAGGSMTWAQLDGAVPDETRYVNLTIRIKRENDRSYVRYAVDGAVLTHGGNEWIEIADTDEMEGAVAFKGTGEVSALSAETEAEAPIVMHALTVPTADHLSVAHVRVAGVEVLPGDDGRYLVERGSVVTVTFAPEAGWALSFPSASVVVRSDMTMPAQDLPRAINVAATVTINEVMAKNGVTLKTDTGFEGLDWIELYNRGDEDANLSGWYMGNDPTKNTSKWTKIEGSCVVPAHGYKIVWFDGDGLCPRWANGEAHVAANLSTDADKHTVFLASEADASKVIQQITLPGGVKDVSYGLGHLEHVLLGPKDAAQYRVGEEGAWTPVHGPVGMSATSSHDAGFRVTSYKLGRQLTSVDVALSAIQDKAWKSGTQPSEETGVPKIAYRAGNQAVSFPTANYANFPVATEDLALVVRGTIVIPESGLWTFSVGSDDGFRLTLANGANSYSMEHAGTRGYGQTYSAFNMDAGAYNLELVYFDRNSGAAVDLSVAKGDYTTEESGGFSTTAFSLIGAPECPVLFGGALAGYLSADVKAEMLGKSETLDWTAAFVVTADDLPTEEDTVRLMVRYADGLVAKLNGTEIARVEADRARTAAEALVFETFAIDPALVKAANTLEITVANDKIGDCELYLEAQVVLTKAEKEFVYFREPTPGRENTTHGYGAMTPAISFSEKHGYKTEPFELTLSCADAPYAPIYYTTDGTSPTEKSTLYTGPIAVSKTTCVRAAVPQDNTILQKDCAATYLFLADILAQTPDVVPEGFPADKAVNDHAMRYGFSAAGLAADPERIRNAFTNSIATFSIVIDPKNLFDKASGIYVNPSGDGRSWEREMMLEQINPNGDDGFSEPAGIRIRGAASRGRGYAKHSFRFFFRNEYGMGTLKYPLFGKEGADEFDKVDLRCSQNYSWANENSGNETFIHECFSRDTQGAMGDYYTKSRYYHLFINGQYWGLYQTEERGDEDFAKTYNGGASANYDVIKTSQPGYNTGASEGTEDAWKALWAMIVNTPDGEKNYRRAMGLNEDGTRNKDYPVYLNPTNLIDFVLNFHFACDSDSPISMSGFINNLYAVRNRVDGDGKLDGFYFLRHDAEHSMGVRGQSNASVDPTAYGTEGAGADWLNYANRFSPAELFWRLTKNDEFKMLVADLYYKHLLKEGGALTAPVAKARFEKRMAEIDSAVVAEAARWSQDRNNPKTYANWQSACNGRLKFIDDRGPYMLSQYRARRWYPSVDAAKAVNELGGTIADGTQFSADDRLYLTGGTQGKVYYTTDGSDPRLADGTVADGAIEYTGGSPVPVDTSAFDKGAEWKYFDAGSKPATDWMAADYDDSAWSSGKGRLGFANSGTFGTTLNRYVGSSGTQVMTFYFRKAFELPENAAEITALKMSLDCDDGYILYINGVEVKRDQVNSSEYEAKATVTNMGEKNVELAVPAGLLKSGANVIAAEVHQCNKTSSDAWWDCALTYPAAVGEATGLAVPAEGMTLTMRVLSEQGEWSAIDTISVKGEEVMSTQAEAVRVAAVYSSTTDGGNVGEFVIITNVTSHAVDLTGVTFACCKHEDGAVPKKLFTVAGGRLEAGETMTITQADCWPSGKITNGKVDMTLSAGDGTLLQTLYIDADWWNGRCDETGFYFVAKEFGDTVTDISQWKPSVSWIEENLRFYEIEGIPAEGNDGAGEYFVLSNLSETVELDLTGVKIFIGKKDDMTKDGDSAAKCKLTLVGGTAAAHSTLKFKQPDYGWGKITDGDLILKIYDAEGALVQYSEIKQKDFDGYKVGLKALRATKFERETGTTDWMEVDLPQSGSEVKGDGFLFYLTGEFTEPVQISPTGDTCCVVLDGATVPGLTLPGAGEFTILASNENQVASLSASAATVTVEGDGALRFEGANTLVSVSNLTVKSGTFAVKSRGVSATKTPVVNVLGNVKQTGGTIDVDLDVATDLQIYGIYVANKDMDAKFSGGTFTAKVGGTKSAAIYGEKGSVNPAFSGDVAVSAVLTGPQARFVNAAGKIKISGGTFDISMPEACDTLVDSRVFKAGSEDKVKAIEISGGTITVAALAPGSEIFSVDGTLDVSGGVLSLQAADDCFSATGDITISGGIVHALSTAGDAIDSNGSVTISGGKVFAFTLSADHDAIDVDPILTEESSAVHNLVILDGATVVAVGGDQQYFHGPDVGSTATIYAEKGLASSKKYVELTGVLAGDNAKTTTVLSVNWNKRHADTFTLIATMPGYDGQGYAEAKDKPTDVYPNACKLNEAVDGVFLRDMVVRKSGFVIEVTAVNSEEAADKTMQMLKAPIDEDTGRPAVSDEDYRAYFVPTAKPVEGKEGVFAVEAVLNEAVVKPVIEATNEIATPFAVGETGGEVIVAAKPGLYYSLVRGTEVGKIDSVRDCQLATGTKVELADTEKLPDAAFYRILVTIDAQPTEPVPTPAN